MTTWRTSHTWLNVICVFCSITTRLHSGGETWSFCSTKSYVGQPFFFWNACAYLVCCVRQTTALISKSTYRVSRLK
ncbi:hypothetical protein IF2G_09368 [Cordyceps javanica]|nr:hypothetical protein IF2G_09368 [Cordyceps javanica]